MTPSVMLVKRILLYVLLVMLAQSNHQVYGATIEAMLWQKVDHDHIVDHEHILCISGDHIRNARLPKTNALYLAATSRKADKGEHKSSATFCGPVPCYSSSNGTVTLGHQHVHLSQVLSVSIYRPDVHKLVCMATLTDSLEGFDATKCTVEIQVKRHSQYKINTGSSLIMECPVLYCKEKPFMEWCKMEEARCVQLKKGKPEWKSNVFTLKLSSVHQNDSGHYRCRAIVGNFSSESHGIKVIVEEKSANIITISPENTTSVSEESQKFGNYKILHIIFASVSMGLSCPFIIICMFCLRRHHAKQKRSSLTPQRQESLVRSSAAAPSHTVGTTHASEESSSLYYCSMASPMQAFLKNTIYDNDVPPWNTERTAPKEPHNDSAAPSIPVLLESPDALTYAALNHAASAERCQRRELTVENDFTEYACINVNK